MPDLSKITLPSGTTYDLKDAGARDLIAELFNYTTYLGVTTTELTDGSTVSTIKINGEDVTATDGCVATYQNDEFIFNGTSWQQFGTLSGLGSLAYKNSATGSTSVTVPATFTTTYTPAAKDVSVTGTTTGSVSVTKSSVSVSPAESGTATYTPAGTNASSSVSGSCTVTPTGSISKGTGTANYTPEGSVSAPTISVKTAGGTTNVTGITSVGSMPTYTVQNETLTITAGSTPTAATTVACKTSDPVYEASQPSFTGTGAELKFTGSSSTGSINGTAEAQTFTGSGARLVTDSEVATDASFTGSSMTSTGSYTPATGSASTTVATTESKSISVTVS